MNNLMKRVQKDLKEIQKNPLVDASAQPEPNDMSMWHANILIPLTLNKKLIKVPIHFLIELPEDYPKNPTGVGFYCTFPYSIGASMAIPDGRLKGLFTLCLNILGNF